MNKVERLRVSKEVENGTDYYFSFKGIIGYLSCYKDCDSKENSYGLFYNHKTANWGFSDLYSEFDNIDDKELVDGLIKEYQELNWVKWIPYITEINIQPSDTDKNIFHSITKKWNSDNIEYKFTYKGIRGSYKTTTSDKESKNIYEVNYNNKKAIWGDCDYYSDFDLNNEDDVSFIRNLITTYCTDDALNYIPFSEETKTKVSVIEPIWNKEYDIEFAFNNHSGSIMILEAESYDHYKYRNRSRCNLSKIILKYNNKSCTISSIKDICNGYKKCENVMIDSDFNKDDITDFRVVKFVNSILNKYRDLYFSNDLVIKFKNE